MKNAAEKNALLAVGSTVQGKKRSLQRASGMITDLFTKINRPVKKTMKISLLKKVVEMPQKFVCQSNHKNITFKTLKISIFEKILENASFLYARLFISPE